MSNYEQENKINFGFTQSLERNKMNKISPLFQDNKNKEIEKVSENITERKTAEATNIIINEKKEEPKEPDNFDVIRKKIKRIFEREIIFTLIKRGRPRNYEEFRIYVSKGKYRKQNGCCLAINRLIKRIHKFVLRHFKHPGLKKLNEPNTPQEFKSSYSNMRKLLNILLYDIYCYYTVPTRFKGDRMIRKKIESNKIKKSGKIFEIMKIGRNRNKVLLDDLISKNREAMIFFKTIKVKDFLEHYFFNTKQINSGEIKIKLIGNEFETYDQDFNNLYSPKEKMAIMEELSK